MPYNGMFSILVLEKNIQNLPKFRKHTYIYIGRLLWLVVTYGKEFEKNERISFQIKKNSDHKKFQKWIHYFSDRNNWTKKKRKPGITRNFFYLMKTKIFWQNKNLCAWQSYFFFFIYPSSAVDDDDDDNLQFIIEWQISIWFPLLLWFLLLLSYILIYFNLNFFLYSTFHSNNKSNTTVVGIVIVVLFIIFNSNFFSYTPFTWLVG